MDKREITESVLEIFREYLKDDEKSDATIKKYMHDIRHFARYAAGKQINKALTLSYKAELEKTYKVTSANSMCFLQDLFGKKCRTFWRILHLQIGENCRGTGRPFFTDRIPVQA